MPQPDTATPCGREARRLLNGADKAVLSYLKFPKVHWLQTQRTHPLARLNAEIQRSTNVLGTFPNDAAITRLVIAMLLEENNEGSLYCRYMQLEGLQSPTDVATTRQPGVQR